MSPDLPIPPERIEQAIFLIRGEKVMLDKDLAQFYGVSTRRLNEAVKRNRERFPADFMFQLSFHEFRNLKSQFATSSSWGGRRTPPYAFTEHGCLMVASVLKSAITIEASIQVVRTFVRLRQMLASRAELSRKLNAFERKYDHQFKVVFDAVRELMTPSLPVKRRIGFQTLEGKKR